MRRALSVMSLLSVIIVLTVAPTAVAQTGKVPSLTSTSRSVEFGDQIAIRGEGWSPNSIINISVCGNDAKNGTSDCDIVNGRVVGVSNRGTFGVSIVVGQPPAPCPCVVRAESQTSSELVTFNIDITGAPELPPDQQFQVPVPDRQLTISNARITGSGPWYSYLGGPAKREVVFAVQNIGEVTVKNAAISLSMGKGPNPKGFVKAPDLGELKPGESRTYSVPIKLPVLALGTYGVQGEIPGFADPVRFRAETSQIPWALVALPLLVLLQVMLIASRNRLRREIEHQSSPIPSPRPIVATPLALPASTAVADDMERRDDIVELRPLPGPATEPAPVTTTADSSGQHTDPAELVGVDTLSDEIAAEVKRALGTTSLRSGDSSPNSRILERIARDVAHTAATRIGIRHSFDHHQVDDLEADIRRSLVKTIGAAGRSQHVKS